jgi:hypothetical protein
LNCFLANSSNKPWQTGLAVAHPGYAKDICICFNICDRESAVIGRGKTISTALIVNE